jgi:hypothetical protein
MEPIKVGNRTYNTIHTVKVSPNPGGGPVNVERRQSRSINDLYMRMLATGELQNATFVKGVTHGSKERVYAMLNDAKVAPRYMRDGEVKKIIDNIDILDTELKNGKTVNAPKKAANGDSNEG